MAKHYRVSDVELDEISLVDKPANRQSKVAIAKRDATDDADPADLFVASLRKSIVQAFEPAEEQLEKLDAGLAEAVQILKGDYCPPGEMAKGKGKVPPQFLAEQKGDDDEPDADDDDEAAPMKKSETPVASDPEVAALRKALDDQGKVIAEFQKRERLTTLTKRLEDAGVEGAEELAKVFDELPATQKEFFIKREVARAAQANEAALFGQFSKGSRGDADPADAAESAVLAKQEKMGEHATYEMAYAELYKGDRNFRRLIAERERAR